MIKTCITLMASAAALFVTVTARKEFVKLIPNGANVNGIVALGHADGTGESDELDDFGKAFAKAGNKWTTALCKADSDGDGQTNGEELGDPCCVWTQGGTPKFTSGASNPGDASMKVTASVLAANSCSAPTSAPTTAPTSAPKTSAPTTAPTSASTLPTTTAPGKADSSSAPTATSASPKTSTSTPSSTASESSTATVAPSNTTYEDSSASASDDTPVTSSTPSSKSSSSASTTTPAPTSAAVCVHSAIAASVVAGVVAFAL